MKRLIWIVSEGSPGHISQSVGLVQALARQIELESVLCETRPRLGGLARMLVRWWMGAAGRPLSAGFMRQVLVCETPRGEQQPDLIVASGGKSVFAARTLAGRFQVPFVFIGERDPYPTTWFHTVFTPSAAEIGANDVAIAMIPTPITPAQVDAAAAAWKERPAGLLWGAVIGGASASHRYEASDWDALALAMNALARQKGIRWLITTSRRTGAEVEARLRAKLDAETVAAAVWWAEKPEKKMNAFLGAADLVLVTQDSVTMVSEAVDAGRPVVVVRPRHTQFAANSFLPGYHARLEETGRVQRRGMDELITNWPEIEGPTTNIGVAAEEMAVILRARLCW